MSERILVRKIGPNLWQWRAANGHGEWLGDAFYTGDINLLKEAVEGRHVWLLLPGQTVVSQRIPVDIKDRKQLLKVLPYEIEESIIDPVEDLHFAFGPLQDDTIVAAYTDLDWLQSSIQEVDGTGAEVQRCSADYLVLPRPEQGWVLLLENGLLLAQLDDSVGFTVEQTMAGAYLAALAGQPPVNLHLFGDTEESLMALHALLPGSVTQNESVTIAEQVAGFWDLANPAQPPSLDFRSGRLARKLPFAKWWQEFKYPIVATAAGFLIALITTSVGLQKADAERKRIVAQTDAVFRQVVPQGTISDPVRQLRTLLGSGPSGRSSNAVVLLAGVAPAISAIDEVVVRSLRYNVESGQLQLNLEAKSFDTFETLRARIAETGLQVEIRSANVYGDMHQAQLRVGEAG